MLIKVNSAAHYGINTIGVDVEVNVASKGFPAFDIVGLPNKAVAESRERVRTALQNSDLDFPAKRITVNLAPADLPKDGSFYDLPIAVGIMAAITGVEIPEKSLFYGELSLDGSLRHTRGTFLLALFAEGNKYKKIFVPKSAAHEGSVIKGVTTVPVTSLSELFTHLAGEKKIKPLNRVVSEFDYRDVRFEFDMKEVLGQEQAKRALEISAAGGHNTLLVGSPGGGKTMLAKAVPSILPNLSIKESLEVTKIYSASGSIPPGGSLVVKRQCRSPHHTTSYAGLIGGGSVPKAGEISLAHRGVLFLDEFSEFPRQVIESLRQPMEDGVVTISRSSGTATFPSRFILIAASNPCPCGYLNHPTKSCICNQFQIDRYSKKISGPILDRIDLYVNVNPVPVEDLSLRDKENGLETSEEIRKRVTKARNIQEVRFNDMHIFTNSEMRNRDLKRFCYLNNEVESILKRAVSKFSLSARAYFKVIKISRTIADFGGSKDIKRKHIAEALQYRKT